MQIDAIGSRPTVGGLGEIQSGAGAALPIPGSEAGGTKTFGKFLMDAMAEVNAAQMKAGDMTARFAAGAPLDVHQVMIAAQEAGVMLNMAIQVRNKVVEAYQEVMRTSM